MLTKGGSEPSGLEADGWRKYKPLGSLEIDQVTIVRLP